MKPISPETLLEQLKWRYATKIFDASKKIPAKEWEALEQSLVLTPSSFGLQPWKFFVITDAETKKKLVAASWNQNQPADCSHHVVFAVKKQMGAADVEKFIQLTSERQGTPLEKLEGYKKMMIGFLGQPADKFNYRQWASLQVYIALGNFMTSAALLGIDTCPMEGIVQKQYDDILNLASQGYETVVACPAGYRSAADKYAAAPKVRYSSGEMIERR